MFLCKQTHYDYDNDYDSTVGFNVPLDTLYIIPETILRVILYLPYHTIF